jgi:hypothetical protein
MMKKYLVIMITLGIQTLPVFATTSWDNPAVLCPEEILPRGLTCLDFSRVDNVYTDFPDSATREVILDWKNNKAADLKVCRNQEVIRRERLRAGSYSPATLEQAWMVVDGGKQVQEKLDAVNAASLKYGMPPQVLLGAMKQESLMSSLGVSPDGGNYSCGMAQLNIQEWCQGMNKLSAEEKSNLGWPEISCDSDALRTDSVKPFYDIAIKNAGSRPSYQLTSEDFKGIISKEVNKSFFHSSADDKRFQAVTSFVHNCQNISLSVAFKAQTLKALFDNFVPTALKNAELYTEGKTFPRACKNAYSAKAYPLHTGWLLAVAMYNAGPAQAKILGHYYQVKNYNFPAINPLGLIEALHWGGKWQKGTDALAYTDQAGNNLSQSWFKSCIVQRHVARVIQHVTLPAESIAKSLEQEGCKTTGVPLYRQVSSGIKE